MTQLMSEAAAAGKKGCKWGFGQLPPMLAKMTAEFLGSIMFHFIGSAAPTPWANGTALMAAVYYTAKVSGGHLNPAVSTVFCLMGFTRPVEAALYAVAQLAGCMVGALLIALTVPGMVPGRAPPPGLPSGCFVPAQGLGLGRVAAWEAIGTVAFIVPVMSVVWYTQNKSGYGNTGPIMVGLSLISSALAVGPWTGAALNPARLLGSALVFDCTRSAVTGAYVGGQMLGAALCPLLIAPWYGISNNAWYSRALPARLKAVMRVQTSSSIELRTIDTEYAAAVYATPLPASA